MNELQPVLSKHGIFIVPEVIEHTREERQAKSGRNLNYSIQRIAFHFTADDGSKVTAVVVGEGMDSGDKASNKALAIAFKYACLQVFCIPTEDLKDPDGDTPPSSTPKRQEPPNPAAKGQGPSPELVAKRKELGKQLVEIIITKNPDELDYFTDQEKQSVKDILKKTGSHPQGIAIVEGLIKKWEEELKKRQAEFTPMPFDVPAMYGEHEPNDGFVDDIPEPSPSKAKPSNKLTNDGENPEIFPDIF
jgi:hypothetical protein